MTEDWSDVLVALLAAHAQFIVVGAHAMAVHGVPRATQDLDVWIEATADNADRVWRRFPTSKRHGTTVWNTKSRAGRFHSSASMR